FDRAIRKEVDFSNEREHIIQFRHNFQSTPGVRLPGVYDDYSTTRVLAMDRIDGVKVTDAAAEFDLDPKALGARLLDVLLKMLFEDGFFHGDLHPGNILVDRAGTIGLIDFGLAGEFTERQRENLLDLLIGMAQEDYALVARVLFDIGTKLPGVRYDYAAFE